MRYRRTGVSVARQSTISYGSGFLSFLDWRVCENGSNVEFTIAEISLKLKTVSCLFSMHFAALTKNKMI